MPSRRHELLAWAVPGCASPASSTTPSSSGPGSSGGTPRWTGPCRPRLVPRFDRRFAVVEERPVGFPAYIVTPRGVDPAGPWSTCTAAGSSRRSTRSTCGTPPGWPGARRPGRDAGLPARARAHLARLVRRRSPTWPARWADEPGGMVLAGDSAGGGYALALALTLRDRGGPQPTQLLLHAPWVDLTTSTPETARSRGRPVAVHRQDAGLRRVVGRLGRRPRPARGHPGARRPRRAAAGADVLRHPRLARAGLPAARPPRGRGRLGPHLRRGAGPDPRLPDAAVHPRGAPGLAADAGVPADERSARVPFAALDPRTAYACGGCARTSSSSSRSAPTPTSTAATSSPRPGTWCCRTTASVLGYARVLDDGDEWRIGRVALAPDGPRPRAGRPAAWRRRSRSARTATSCSTRRRPLAGWYAALRLRGDRPGVPRGRHPAPADARLRRTS